MGARRLSNLAIVTGLVAVVLVFAASGDGGDEGGDGGGAGAVVAGLLLILGPLISAAAVRSIAGSSLLRPLGAVVTAAGALTAVVHLGLAVDAQGGAGWLSGAPAIATSVLLVAAVVRGPERQHPRDTRAAAPSPAPDGSWDVRSRPEPQGPPLDVLGPLGAARDRAARATIAWAVAVVAVVVVAVPVLRVLGWPQVTERLDARVVEVRPFAARTAVTFEAEGRRRTVHWTYVIDDSTWKLGQRHVVYLDDDGRVHEDQQFGLAGMPLLLPVMLIALAAAFALRRLWGVSIAWWDAGHGSDAPALGYAAVIDDPAPKSWRPLLAVWRHDPPTEGRRLPRPDAVFRADEQLAEHVVSNPSSVVVRRAWIDTGVWRGAKPRWVGFDAGVAVPHRRSLFGRWYVRTITRKGKVADVVDLRHGAPLAGGPFVPASRRDDRDHDRRSLLAMVVWRLLAAVVAVVFGLLRPLGEGHEVETGPAVIRRG